MKIRLSAHPRKHPNAEKRKQMRNEMKDCANREERKALRMVRSFNRLHEGGNSQK